MGWVSCAWGCVTAVSQYCRAHQTACPANTPVRTILIWQQVVRWTSGGGGGGKKSTKDRAPNPLVFVIPTCARPRSLRCSKCHNWDLMHCNILLSTQFRSMFVVALYACMRRCCPSEQASGRYEFGIQMSVRQVECWAVGLLSLRTLPQDLLPIYCKDCPYPPPPFSLSPMEEEVDRQRSRVTDSGQWLIVGGWRECWRLSIIDPANPVRLVQ